VELELSQNPEFKIISCHRTEGSREIALRLRELSVLPPLKAKGKVLLSSNNLLLKPERKKYRNQYTRTERD